MKSPLINIRVLLIYSSCLIVFLLMFASCKKAVDIEPPTSQLTANSVFDNDATAISLLTGVYAKMSNVSYTSTLLNLPSLSSFCGLSADELTLWSGAFNSSNLINKKQVRYYTNTLRNNAVDQYGSEFWTSFYNIVYSCNTAIEGLATSTKLTPAISKQLLGEAKFVRGLLYFYLVNLYGDIPLVLNTNYKQNLSLSRSTRSVVYQQIIADLKVAEGLLSSKYIDATILNSTAERTRPTKWAAAALLARAYLYNGDLTSDPSNYVNAEVQASNVITNTSLYDTTSLVSVFLKNSKEAIWQLQPVITGWNTQDGRLFIIPRNGFTTSNPMYLSKDLYNVFEFGDKRKTTWINSYTNGSTVYYYPYKYRSATNGAPLTEYLMILRLGEQYLIRAEARAQQNKIAEAQSDINVIRLRAGLANTTANDKQSLLSAIMQERRVELFTELGHRWLDLKRTNQIDAVMSTAAPQKLNGGPWQTYQQLYPLPYNDVTNSTNLRQNPGY